MTSTTYTSPETVKSLRRTRQASLCEVVQRLIEIHARLATHYQEIARDARHERVRLALQFLHAHENALVEYLQSSLDGAPQVVLDRRFKYVPDLFGDDLFATLAARQIETAEELAELVHGIHCAIDAVYEPLTGSMLPEELHDTVDKLRSQEREHVITQLRAVMDD